MGIQVQVDIKDLKAGFTLEFQGETYPEQDEDGNDVERERVVLYVTFPSGHRIMSYDAHSLVFDNKRINHHLTDELDELGIPYIRS